MKKTKLPAVIACALLIIMILSGCSSANYAADSEAKGEANYGSQNDWDYRDDGADYNGGITADIAGKPTYDTQTQGEDVSGGQYDRQVIKTFKISAETKVFDDAIGFIASRAAEVGGYVESSSFSGKSLGNTSYYHTRGASYTIRIPADMVDEFLAELGGTLNIVENSSTLSDVSAQYYDIVSRLQTLETEKEALIKMYDKATDIDYMLKVQSMLYDVIEEIEAYTTQLNYYKNRVAYSTVYLNLVEVIEYTEENVEPKTFGEQISSAFSQSWKNFASGCREFAVGLVYALPTLIVLAVIGGTMLLIILFIVRRPKSKKKSGRDEK